MVEIEELARTKRTAPKPTRDKGQRSIDLPPWLWVWKTPWAQKEWYNAKNWRAFIQRQPFAVTCRETLISNYLALEWQIDAKDSEKRDELKEEIEYHTEFFDHTGDYSYTEIIEWVGKDLLDIPFGSGANTNIIKAYLANSDALLININISQYVPGGIRFARGAKNRMLARVNDDLAGLDEFNIRCIGYKHFPLDPDVKRE